MTRHEHDEFGTESRDIIDGLRRLAQSIETPPDLLPNILAAAEQRLPQTEARRSRWRQAITAWLCRPWLWAPVMAVACFVAGVWFSPRQFDISPETRGASVGRSVLEQRAASEKSLPRQDQVAQRQVPDDRQGYRIDLHTRGEAEMAASALPSQEERESWPSPQSQLRQLSLPRAASPRDAPTSRLQPQVEPAPAPHVQMTVTLPVHVYDRLLQKARQREQDVTALLREAVEQYLRE